MRPSTGLVWTNRGEQGRAPQRRRRKNERVACLCQSTRLSTTGWSAGRASLTGRHRVPEMGPGRRGEGVGGSGGARCPSSFSPTRHVAVVDEIWASKNRGQWAWCGCLEPAKCRDQGARRSPRGSEVDGDAPSERGGWWRRGRRRACQSRRRGGMDQGGGCQLGAGKSWADGCTRQKRRLVCFKSRLLA